jgi:hypothetical protein
MTLQSVSTEDNTTREERGYLRIRKEDIPARYGLSKAS